MVAIAINESSPLLKQTQDDDAMATETPSSTADESFGYLLLLGSALGFSLMYFIVRLVVGYHNFPVSSVLLIRGAIQSFFALVSIGVFSSFQSAFSLTWSQVDVVTLSGVAGGLMKSLNYLL